MTNQMVKGNTAVIIGAMYADATVSLDIQLHLQVKFFTKHPNTSQWLTETSFKQKVRKLQST